MRGKRLQLLHQLLVFRITPAHAGKTQKTFSFSTRRADHPRACGENDGDVTELMADGGSPPRMRGKLADGLGEAYTGRITPAHAGKTRFESATKYYPTDHPRACGENTTTVIVIPERSGSPPRMRGKQGHGA